MKSLIIRRKKKSPAKEEVRDMIAAIIAKRKARDKLLTYLYQLIIFL
jgi:hypothetical protein